MLNLRTAENQLRDALAPGIVLRMQSDTGDFALLGVREQALVQSAVRLRQMQFAAGRQCAHAALGELSHSYAELLKKTHGGPTWPTGVVGSITHCRGIAAAIVASAVSYTGVGLDIECAQRFPASVVDRILHPAEQRFAHDAKNRIRYFCAKEAVYKCLAPAGAVDLDFLDVQIVWHGDDFVVLPISAAATRIEGIPFLTGRCVDLGTHVAVCAVIPVSART